MLSIFAPITFNVILTPLLWICWFYIGFPSVFKAPCGAHPTRAWHHTAFFLLPHNQLLMENTTVFWSFPRISQEKKDAIFHSGYDFCKSKWVFATPQMCFSFEKHVFWHQFLCFSRLSHASTSMPHGGRNGNISLVLQRVLKGHNNDS